MHTKHHAFLGVFALAALLVALPSAAQSASHCLSAQAKEPVEIPIQNPSFDQIQNKQFVGWVPLEHVHPGMYEFVSDTTDPHSAPSSARIRQIQPEMFGMLRQVFRVEDCWLGKTVRLSGFLRSENVSENGGGLIIQATQETSSVVVYDHMTDRLVKGTQAWAPYSVQIKVPDNAYYLRIGIMLQGAGTLWGDDLKLELLN